MDVNDIIFCSIILIWCDTYVVVVDLLNVVDDYCGCDEARPRLWEWMNWMNWKRPWAGGEYGQPWEVVGFSVKITPAYAIVMGPQFGGVNCRGISLSVYTDPDLCWSWDWLLWWFLCPCPYVRLFDLRWAVVWISWWEEEQLGSLLHYLEVNSDYVFVYSFVPACLFVLSIVLICLDCRSNHFLWWGRV